ncbi:helix-turn-helix transcriptional regulator [Thermocrispum sp.]|uniref:HTH cro/C1-type domain-containing protein n=1 Tax=Thermocrispum agreste TaxID=37925 RepID=A0A2W4ISM6_9PSEU|nr:helix-turn-helix transcriptional regulator [Thermocrispum sp.]PZM89882.1 MAG: hypothetical protein DIU77_18570 [Thermocrispum agreste]
MAKSKVKAKRLGAALRQSRESAGLSLRDAAKGVGWDFNRLHRIEKGQGPYNPEEISGLLGLYRVTGDRRDRILATVRSLDEPGWWELAGVTKTMGALADYENDAQKITEWAPLLIPGLLQTMDYARSAIGFDPNLDTADIEARLTVRVRRQQILKGDVEYRVFLGLTALKATVGSREILARQLAALLNIGQQDNITLRVVLPEADARGALLGPFSVLEFDEWQPVVDVENLRGTVFLDTEEHTGIYLGVLSQLNAVALGETESMRLIERLKEEVEGSADEQRVAQV